MVGGKIPYSIGMKDDSPFVFAGFWEGWKDPATNEWLRTCTIITGEPNELVARIHTRMPVILLEEDHAKWLGEYEDGDFKGSVATLELRRSVAIASAKLDRHRAEQAENEAVQQNSPPSQRTSARLAFADHMDCLVAGDRTPSSPKRSEMLTRVDSSLDRPVVLFQDVIQVRHRPLPTVFV